MEEVRRDSRMALEVLSDQQKQAGIPLSPLARLLSPSPVLWAWQIQRLWLSHQVITIQQVGLQKKQKSYFLLKLFSESTSKAQI